MNKFKVGDIVTWNDENQECYDSVMRALSDFGFGPFMITRKCDDGETYYMKEIGRSDKEIMLGWYEWALKHCSILTIKTGFIRSNISL